MMTERAKNDRNSEGATLTTHEESEGRGDKTGDKTGDQTKEYVGRSQASGIYQRPNIFQIN
jgi:hypothetical protein